MEIDINDTTYKRWFHIHRGTQYAITWYKYRHGLSKFIEDPHYNTHRWLDGKRLSPKDGVKTFEEAEKLIYAADPRLGDPLRLEIFPEQTEL